MSGVPPWVRLLRPQNGVISLVGTVVGGISVRGLWSGSSLDLLLSLIMAGCGTFLATSAGNVLNDYLDREGDKLNHPDRPLPRGEISPAGARNFARALFALSVLPLLPLIPGLGLRLGPSLPFFLLTLLVWGTSVLLLVGYEYWWKARGLPGNATVAYLTGAVFLFGGAVAGNPVLALPWLLMAFFATLSREIIKDMEDVKGDDARDTLPRRYGLRWSAQAGRGAVIAAIVLSPLPVLTWLPWDSVAGIAYLALVAVSDVVFVLSVAWLPERLHREQGLSKLAMVFALVAFVGAALR
ncbi:MAG: geranylgeranylglycerol-phosphate geranylgeranyltransferase [Candidatus Thermoplasmatota archaeon]|nr:geranylgeranylglycerol-phosphate geranylgeranyltransferase [Candidatus Thermoplasmatota archaeon]